MIDYHSHVVYDVDDGAKTLEDTVDMIKEAENAGFTDIIATPHYMENYFEKDASEIKEKNRKNTTRIKRTKNQSKYLSRQRNIYIFWYNRKYKKQYMYYIKW